MLMHTVITKHYNWT